MKIETKFSSKSNIFFHRFSCFFIGLLVPFPFEIMSGLYISYFTSAILIFYLRFNLGILIFLALFFSLIAFSFLMNDLVGSFLSLLIVTYTSIFMVSTVSDKFDVVYFIKGLKLSVFFVLVLFALAAIYVGSLDPYYLFIANRTWANEFVDFSGNGLAMLMVCIFILLYRHGSFSILPIFIALLTTSRLSLLAFLIFFRKRRLRYICFSVCLIFVFLAYFIWGDTAYFQRLIKLDDRFIVYSESIDIILNNTLFGIGPVDFGQYRHSHNSFLYVFSRYGIFAFFAYMFLVVYFFVRIYKFFGFFVFCIFFSFGFFQIGYQNIALVIIFPILFKVWRREFYHARS